MLALSPETRQSFPNGCGETVFPKLPDSFFTDFVDGGANPMLKLCADAALDGKACPGTLAVTLPSA